MASRLELALRQTTEEHADTFEKFANAFLVDDYPELEGLGGKKDKGMDGRVIVDPLGTPSLVVQSCISPASGARTKVLHTMKKLDEGTKPSELIYCTSATIGAKLDQTKKELRVDYRVTLTVCDAIWFCQREHTSPNRAKLSEQYADAVLAPIIGKLDANRLYNSVLTDQEERVAVQYLEAMNLDRQRGSNITNGVFDSLIVFALRDSDPAMKGHSEETIIATVSEMFSDEHTPRVREIVSARLKQLEKKGAIHHNPKVHGWVLSFPYREKVAANIAATKERDIVFRDKLRSAILKTGEDEEVEYEYPIDELVQLGHDCIFWYMREQGRNFADPSHGLLNIYNAERLVERYMKEQRLPNSTAKLDQEVIMDLLPAALNIALNAEDEQTKTYLRAKADLFIIHALMEVTPDVQRACRKVIGGDIVYLDTSMLIRCIAEIHLPDSNRPVLRTLQAARALGFQLRTWRAYVEELVAHLKGPVLLEWGNHLRHMLPEQLETAFKAAPTLIEVFHRWTKSHGGTIEDAVQRVIGTTDEIENAIEFLKEECGIETEQFPPGVDASHELWNRIYTTWCASKRHIKPMALDRFELLVRHDVSAYLAIPALRMANKVSGPNYGHKYWLLTFDRMPWRIAKEIVTERGGMYAVAMSLDYLMNVVATVAYSGATVLPEEALPATLILGELDLIPSELRRIFQGNWDPKEKKYIRNRKMREIVHKLKVAESIDYEGSGAAGKLDIGPDEQF